MADREKLISLEGLAAFKTKIEEEISEASTPISKESGNAIVEKTDGLYVADKQGVEISKESGNTLTEKTDGLYVPTTTVPTKVSELQNDAGFMTDYTETDPTVPSHVKSITAENIASWNAKVDQEAGKSLVSDSEIARLAGVTNYDDTAISGRVKALEDAGYIPSTEKGVNNGVATLGSDGKIPSAQLPSYVDDVEEYDAKASFPTTGESGKIYIDKATNITYRWSGSDYVAIGSDLALGETASTAYAGNKGKANAEAISALQTTVNALPTSFAPANAQANVIETIKVNNTALTPTEKAVNISVPTVTDTYSSTSSNAMSGKAVSSAIDEALGSQRLSLVMSTSEPTRKTQGMVWIDGSATTISVYDFLYQASAPTNAKTGCGWVG